MNNKIAVIFQVPFLAIFILLLLYPVQLLAEVEQGTPVDSLQIEVPFYEYKLDRKDDPEALFKLNLPIALELRGIYGPLAKESSLPQYYWEKFAEEGLRKAIERMGRNPQEYLTPFMRIIGMQAVGTPVTIKIHAPKPEEIKLPSPMENGNLVYKIDRRRISFNQIRDHGYVSFYNDEIAKSLQFKQDNDNLEITWTPVVEKDGDILAPVVFDLTLSYRLIQDVLINGKSSGNIREYWLRKRIAWFALPVCGQQFGDTREPLICPVTIAAPPVWKQYDLGPISLYVPDNWDAETRGGSGKFELGNELAGIMIVREAGGEKFIEKIKNHTESLIKINSLAAIFHKRSKNG